MVTAHGRETVNGKLVLYPVQSLGQNHQTVADHINNLAVVTDVTFGRKGQVRQDQATEVTVMLAPVEEKVLAGRILDRPAVVVEPGIKVQFLTVGLASEPGALESQSGELLFDLLGCPCQVWR